MYFQNKINFIQWWFCYLDWNKHEILFCIEREKGVAVNFVHLTNTYTYAAFIASSHQQLQQNPNGQAVTFPVTFNRYVVIDMQLEGTAITQLFECSNESQESWNSCIYCKKTETSHSVAKKIITKAWCLSSTVKLFKGASQTSLHRF